MLNWSAILVGAAMSAIAAGAVVAALVRPRRALVIATASLAAFLGPLSWNAILHAVEGRRFFVDAPIAAFPVSWQDTGSGVFTIAVAAALLGLGGMARDPGRRLLLVAILTALPVLLVDIYLY